MENKRAISTAFLDNLKKSRILEIVKNDRTLDIELRGDIITVYYRGCAILTVLENGKFRKNDAKYYSHCDKNGEKQYEIESFEPTNENLDQYLMHAKYAIDKFNGYVKENAETETQQLIRVLHILKSCIYFSYSFNECTLFSAITLRFQTTPIIL